MKVPSQPPVPRPPFQRPQTASSSLSALGCFFFVGLNAIRVATDPDGNIKVTSIDWLIHWLIDWLSIYCIVGCFRNGTVIINLFDAPWSYYDHPVNEDVLTTRTEDITCQLNSICSPTICPKPIKAPNPPFARQIPNLKVQDFKHLQTVLWTTTESRTGSHGLPYPTPDGGDAGHDPGNGALDSWGYAAGAATRWGDILHAPRAVFFDSFVSKIQLELIQEVEVYDYESLQKCVFESVSDIQLSHPTCVELCWTIWLQG